MARRFKRRRRGRRRFSRRKRSAIGTLFGIEKKYNDQAYNIAESLNEVYVWGHDGGGASDSVPYGALKFFRDASPGSTNYSDQYLGATQLGSGYQDRVGKKLTVASMLLELTFNMNTNLPAPAAGTPFDTTLVYYIVLDKTPTASDPSWTDIWSTPLYAYASGTSAIPSIYPWRNPDNVTRFKILHSGVVAPRPDIITGSVSRAAPIVVKMDIKKARGLQISFTRDDTTGIKTNQRTNGISLWVWAIGPRFVLNSGTSATPVVAADFSARARTRFFSS